MELWTNQRSSTRNKEMCPDMASMIWIPARPQRRRQRWRWACLLRRRWARAARPRALRRRQAASVLFLLSFPESLQHLGFYFAVLSHLHTSRGPWGNQPIGAFQKSILITFILITPFVEPNSSHFLVKISMFQVCSPTHLDCKNWNKHLHLSTQSWVAHLGQTPDLVVLFLWFAESARSTPACVLFRLCSVCVI